MASRECVTTLLRSTYLFAGIHDLRLRPEGDLICELMYMGSSPYGWNQAFECIAGPKYSSGPTSLSASGRREVREAPVSDKVSRTPLRHTKLPFTKPAK